MLKKKQIELINNIFDEIKLKFPEAELGEISFGSEETWVDIYLSDGLFGKEKLDGLTAEHAMNIRMTYGFPIIFLAKPLKKVILSR